MLRPDLHLALDPETGIIESSLVGGGGGVGTLAGSEAGGMTTPASFVGVGSSAGSGDCVGVYVGTGMSVGEEPGVYEGIGDVGTGISAETHIRSLSLSR